jgi:YegS/Rv2252/BmrU family lipid kinase
MKNKDKWYVIINPISGNGFVKRKKSKILKALKYLKADYEIAFTQYAKHEIELVNQAMQKGFANFISVGGDGTLHHIVNGVFLQNIIPIDKINIGVIPVGTGNDWVKQYNIPLNIKENINILNRKKLFKQDIGKIDLNGRCYYFNNVAGLGLDAFVVKNLNKKLGKLSYVLAAFKSVFQFKKSKIVLQFDKNKLVVNSLLVSIGICKYSGGGMQFTNNVLPDDGLFDITIVKDLNPLALFANVHRLYNGKLTNHKKVMTFKTNKLKLDILDNTTLIQADGELLGSGNVAFNVIPKALNFIIP